MVISLFFCETQELTDFFCINHILKFDSASTEATDQTYLVKINSENCTYCTCILGYILKTKEGVTKYSDRGYILSECLPLHKTWDFPEDVWKPKIGRV